MIKSKMNTNQLRDYAVSLGADRNRLYGTSKQSMILMINRMEKTLPSNYWQPGCEEPVRPLPREEWIDENEELPF